MSADLTRITGEFKSRLIETHITVAGSVDAARTAQLKEFGWVVFLECSDEIKQGNFPKLILYDTKTIEDNGPWFIDKDNAIHLALGNKNEVESLADMREELIDAFRNYYRIPKTGINDTGHTIGNPDVTEYFRKDDNPSGYDIRGRMGIYVYGQRNEYGARKLGNTWGHILQSKSEWFTASHHPDPRVRSGMLETIHKEQMHLLEMPFRDDWDCRDLLRDLRIRAGRNTIEDVPNLLGIGQTTWSAYENKHRFHGIFVLARIADINFLKFPELETDGVRYIDPVYTDKFFSRMGHANYCYIQNSHEVREHLFGSLQNMLDAYAKDEINFTDLPTVNDLYNIIMRNLPQKKEALTFQSSVASGDYNSLKDVFTALNSDHGLTLAQLDIMEKLPFLSVSGNLYPQPFNRDRVVEVLTKGSDHVGKLLKDYRKVTNQSLDNIGIRKKCTRENIRLHEGRSFHSDMGFIFTGNPYKLPADEYGKIKSQVVEEFHKVNIMALRKLYNPQWQEGLHLTEQGFQDILAGSATQAEFAWQAAQEMKKQPPAYSAKLTYIKPINFVKNRFFLPVDDSGKPDIECLTAFYDKFMRESIEKGTYMSNGRS